MTEYVCEFCKQTALEKCIGCKKPVCDSIHCGQETVEGYMCGSYTQWGCSRKYTNCDNCINEKAIHEGDFQECEMCGLNACAECIESHTCGSAKHSDTEGA